MDTFEPIRKHRRRPKAADGVRYTKHCDEKAQYRDQEQAKRAIRMLGVKGTLRAYECIFCRRWHLTSQDDK